MKPSQPNFCHPYEPYTIQLQFMEELYNCLENGQIGIFESPTGTGKSLSLICGSLTWLRDHGRQSINEAIAIEPGDEDDPPWMVEAAVAERRKQLLQTRKELEAQLAAVRVREERLQRNQNLHGHMRKRQKVVGQSSESSPDDEEQFMLADYESDSDNPSHLQLNSNQAGLSVATAALLSKLQGPVAQNQGEEQPPIETRIFYCSRTHSQLSQFVNELRRVTLPPSIEIDPSQDEQNPTKEHLKHISLGSRKNLCINPKVSSLQSNTLINERCREIQKSGTSEDQKCKYLPAKDEASRWTGFRDHALSRIRDIEDLANLGRQLEVCPYYASRTTVPSSEIVTLPYPLLLQKSARESLKLALKDQIIIIDEAHNLVDAISSANSTAVTLDQLRRSIEQLIIYVQAFKTRLKGKNRVYVTQILRLLQSITKCAQEKLQTANPKAEQIISANELMAGKGVDQINPHKLSIYLQESKLALKVEGFARNRQEKASKSTGKNPLRADDLTTAQSFMLSLMNPSAEGIIYLSSTDGEPRLRYTLLDPKNHFRDVIEDARAVVLAGGTMSPMSDYAEYLFPYVNPTKLVMHSFGHVIPSSNLISLSLNSGSTGVEFDFTFEKRRSPSMIDEIGKTLLDVCKIIPDGVVVFLPSYDYLTTIIEQLKHSDGNSQTLFDQLSQVKPIYWEAKEQPSTEDLFDRYARAIDEGKGGLLFSVVGGKLSEGINFSDKLGRAVVVIGLPFPNMHSAEWKAKIEHVEKAQMEILSSNTSITRSECDRRAKAAGRDYYENACMRAVNQCIGRAIRHRNDYAAILLMDRRYRSQRIHSKLPAWIRQSMTEEQNSWSFDKVKGSLKTFFKVKT